MTPTFSYDDIPVGVCIVRRDRVNLEILYANKTMARIMEQRELTGKTIDTIWKSPEMADLAKKLKSPMPPHTAILPFLHKDGYRQWVLLNIMQTDWAGSSTYTLWATDISSSQEAQEELKKAVDRADALAEHKSNFLATMSHEMRTPMQSVFGLLELIEAERPTGNILAMTQTAKQSAAGLLEILNDILDFAKMDADKMDLDMFEVPLRTLVRGILEALAVKTLGRDVILVDDFTPDVPFVVVGDPKRLRQILINLTGNALKFTEKGAVTITVNTAIQHIKKPKKGLGLRFEIRDTGIGMSEDACAKLFQPFTQADNTTSRKFGGTGLGLSICKKLVELMGGKIGVTSKIGEGSVFWFEIPTEEVSTDANVLEMPDLEGISVLSVEDHPQGAIEIVKSLKSMNATVESTPTYQEALQLVKRRPFDVGVIDQGLPDGLGVDLIREIMEIRPFMGLIMYTVRDDVGLQHTLQSLGVTYLSKPASRIGLGEAIKDAASKAERVSIEGPTRLLIAEDTVSVRDVLQRQLKALGVEATFVVNGREALEAVHSGEYGILFTDLHMPEIDGYEVVNIVRKEEESNGNKQHYPIIALTADVQMSQRQVYMSYGFDECLLKPVSLGQFRRLLIRWGLLKEDDVPALSQASALPPAIDKEALKDLMGAFDDTTIEMLRMFIDMTEPIVTKIRDAQANDSYHDLKEAAHSLKGAARSACANRLGDMAAQLQTDAEAGKPSHKLVEDVDVEFERVKKDILCL